MSFREYYLTFTKKLLPFVAAIALILAYIAAVVIPMMLCSFAGLPNIAAMVVGTGIALYTTIPIVNYYMLNKWK